MKSWLKRALALCLSATLLLSLAACSGGTQQEEPSDTDGLVEVGTEEELTEVREDLIKASEITGLGEIEKMELYENGVRITGSNYIQAKDNKKVYYSGDIKRVVNYPDGYILDIPQDWVPDYSMSSVRVRYVTDEVTLIATNEDSFYQDYGSAENYIESVFQYITTEDYQRLNRVNKLSEETVTVGDDYQAYVLRMQVLECEASVKSYYTYVVLYDGVKRCVQLMFKAVDDRDFSSIYNSFKTILVKGMGVDTITYPCEDNPNWNEETKAYYDSLKNSDTVSWGIFEGNLDTNPLRIKIPAIEKKLSYTFPIVSTYAEMDYDFPLDYANAATEEGRVVQFTYHMSEWNDDNLSMGRACMMLDVYRGLHDDDFVRVAQQIAEYATPTLFRVNNEMNSDWTVWSAVNCMLDPEIFQEAWIRMYNIFTEQGANAYCIWIWNPQSDHSYPNTKWNEVRTYMPGAEYVDMIGLTYYNFGDESTWGEFEVLYDALDTYYGTYFGDWAWIISEFGCSDTQEPSRKAQWITNMFDCFAQGKYPNIKAAVWFSVNDYEGSVVTHKLVLDESTEILEAFKAGLQLTQ